MALVGEMSILKDRKVLKVHDEVIQFLIFGIDPSLICLRAHILVTTLSWKAKVDRKLDLFII